MLCNVDFGKLLAFLCGFLLPLSLADDVGCTFKKHLSKHPYQDRLKPLIGKRYAVTDDLKKYTYDVGICVYPISPPVAKDKVKPEAGVVQLTLDGQGRSTDVYHNIGLRTEAEIMGGTDWIMLEYEGGDPYESHCTKEGRRAIIMIVCDPSEDQGHLRLIEENNNKTDDCYYLFELDHSAACTSTEPKFVGLSIGSILLIVLFVFAGLYLVLGFLYQRFVVHARGLEQIPNLSFWQDFGNLQADGCSLICRCGKSPSYCQPRQNTYRGVGDDQLDDDDGNDDHLLPM